MKQPIFLIIILISSLSGCAQQTFTPVINDREAYQQQLAQLKHWQLDGKIAVRHANKSDSAALRWIQVDDHFDIFLSGPLGAGATRLIGTPKQLSIQNGKEETISISDPKQSVEKNLGWTFPFKELPLEKLPQWIVGYSAGANAQFNLDHTLASFNQNDWRVDFVEYQTVGQWLLPAKIILKHEDMQVRIVITRWEIQ